jgi:hypothetical protein
MRNVTLDFGPSGTIEVHLPAGEPAWTPEQARSWLDDKFVALDCEPLRASGKLLTADKVLAVTRAIGHRDLAADEALRHDLARAVLGALGKQVVTVDADGLALRH